MIFSSVTRFVVGVSLVGSVTDSEVNGITVQGSTVAISAKGQVSGTTGLAFTKNTVARGTVGISVINLTSSTIPKMSQPGTPTVSIYTTEV